MQTRKLNVRSVSFLGHGQISESYMYLLHKICASEVERGKKLEGYESFIGFFWNMAPGNVWIQNLKKCQNWAHTKNDGSMKNFFFLKRSVKQFLFFLHLAFEHTFVFRTTVFILAVKSCFLSLFSDVIFQQWAKKSYFFDVSQGPKNSCISVWFQRMRK